MNPYKTSVSKHILIVSLLLTLLLIPIMLIGLSVGSTDHSTKDVLMILLGGGDTSSTLGSIIWGIRLPRVILAVLVGAALSLGGLVFQALLHNALAEPYILGISGGSAVGAIIGILLGFSHFRGVALCAFAGSMVTLSLVLIIVSGEMDMRKDSLILAGVMVNALCGSIIMFLISITQDSRLHSILFWLMGDLSMSDRHQVLILSATVVPCFVILFFFARPMNLLLMGEELAANMGLSVQITSLLLLMITSFMVSTTVCYTGLLGFVGLVIPHMLRLLLGADHRLLIPSCILGGGAYLVLCDMLARSVSAQGEMPVGIITAMIGAPLFIFLLWRSRR
ncbi:MAG: iron ABC transporter permease [Syntrophobacteraceae bacterium]